ncbi:MAG: DUF5110 domain-containing protein, partial [Oscillospiraceae bacterium]|nr:DUF5110 domain-containing protein [Oscillospiraceae bacterium]
GAEGPARTPSVTYPDPAPKPNSIKDVTVEKYKDRLDKIYDGPGATKTRNNPAAYTEIFNQGANQIKVLLLDDDVIRVRVGPGGVYGNDLSRHIDVVTSVVMTDDMWPGATYTTDTATAGKTVFNTSKMIIEVIHSPLTVSIYDVDGNPYIKNWVIDFTTQNANWRSNSDTTNGMRREADGGVSTYQQSAHATFPDAVSARWDKPTSEIFYGFGDVRSTINKGGNGTTATSTMIFAYNSDSDYHQSPQDRGYKVVPMYMSNKGYGVFLNNYSPSRWDLGATSVPYNQITPAAAGAGYTQVMAGVGEMDLYIFGGYNPGGGTNFARISDSYTQLTGRPAMLSKSELGFHQGGAANFQSPGFAVGVAEKMREINMPLDSIYFDDYDRDNTASAYTPEFVSRMLHKYNTKITFGCGMPYETDVGGNSRVYNLLDNMSDGKKGYLVSGVNESGFPAFGERVVYWPNWVWNATEIDFFSNEASDIDWDVVYKALYTAGATAGMNDFGELDYVPRGPKVYFPSQGVGPGYPSVQEAASIYGLAFFEQMVTRGAAFNGSRWNGMPRTGHAGTQRYGNTFTGDSTASFSTTSDGGGLLQNIYEILNMSMSGFSNTGTGGIGGWMGNPNAATLDRLITRWAQAEAFLPFAMIHGDMGGDSAGLSSSRLLFNRSVEVQDRVRVALDRRYQMLPYYYSLMYEAHTTGKPIIRPLVYETNGEAGTETQTTQFFVGSGLMAAPVLVDNATSSNIYLPSGTWVDGNDKHTTYAGGRSITYTLGANATTALDAVPFFYKAGAIMTTGPKMQYTSEKPLNPLTIDYFPSTDKTSFTLFEDDGEIGYEKDQYCLTELTGQKTIYGVKFTINQRETHGGYDPVPGGRNIEVNIRLIDQNPKSVTVNGVPYAFSYDEDTATVKLMIADDAAEKVIVI